MSLWKSASIPMEAPPGESEALRSLTAWERVVFSGLVKRMEWAAANVKGTKERVACKGFVWVVQLAIAQELLLVAAAAGMGANAVNLASDVTSARWLWPIEAFGYLLAGALLCWCFFRQLTMRQARRLFVAGDRAQGALAEFASAPTWGGVLIWAPGALAVDVFAIGVILLNAAFTAPRVTGAFFLALDWLLVVIWAVFAQARLGRRASWRPNGHQAPSAGTDGPSRKAGATNWAVAASAVYAVAILLAQSTVGHGLARDAAALAATTTTSPAAATTVPLTPATGPPFNGDPNDYICETLMDATLAGLAQGQDVNVVISTFKAAAGETMDNSSIALKWLQLEAPQYERQIKAVGRAQAKAEVEIAVLGECPTLVSEGFTSNS